MQELGTMNIQLRIITEDNIDQIENMSFSDNINKLLMKNKEDEIEKDVQNINFANIKELDREKQKNNPNIALKTPDDELEIDYTKLPEMNELYNLHVEYKKGDKVRYNKDIKKEREWSIGLIQDDDNIVLITYDLENIENISSLNILEKTDNKITIKVTRKDIYIDYTPPYIPGTPPYPPGSPGYDPNSPPYAPGSPAYAPGSPAYAPGSPAYAPGSPAYAPGSPAYAPGSPAYAPGSPQYAPDGSPIYTPKSPPYSPEYPFIMPHTSNSSSVSSTESYIPPPPSGTPSPGTPSPGTPSPESYIPPPPSGTPSPGTPSPISGGNNGYMASGTPIMITPMIPTQPLSETRHQQQGGYEEQMVPENKGVSYSSILENIKKSEIVNKQTPILTTIEKEQESKKKEEELKRINL